MRDGADDRMIDRLKARLPWWAVLVVVAVLTLVWAVFYWRWYIDDTFIYTQYARNLVRDGQFAFNRGEPTFAVTGPTWVLLMAAVSYLVRDPLVAAKAIGIAAGIGTLAVYQLLARQVVRARTWLVWLATLVWAADAWWARTPFTGMESAAAVLIVLAVILLRMREYERGFEGFSWSVLVAGVGIGVRPEVGLLLGLALLYRLVVQRRIVPVLGEGLIALAGLAPLLVYLFATFGTVVPNTFAAKQSLGPWVPAFVDTVVRTAKIVGVTQALAVLLLVAGVVAAPRVMLDRKHWLAYAWIVTLPAFYIVRAIGPYSTSRYLIMMTPLLVIYGVAGLEQLAARLPRWDRVLVPVAAGALVAQALLVQFAYVLPSSQKSIRDFDSAWLYEAEWIKANSPEDARIATGQIGIIGYYSDRYIIDLGALLDPSVLGSAEREGLPAYDYLREHGATHLVTAGEPVQAGEHLEPVLRRTLTSGIGLAGSGSTDMIVWRIRY